MERQIDYERIERLLGEAYWIVDILPRQVPKDSAGQYFAVEQAFLRGRRGRKLREAYADLLLRLNCYVDFLVFGDGEETAVENPPPEELAKRITDGCGRVSVLLDAEDALIDLDGGDTYATVYHPDEELLGTIRSFAAACGLFVWRTEENGEE